MLMVHLMNVVLVTSIVVFQAGAGVLASHSGSVDPILEGWGLSGTADVGPINDGGVNAWFTDDNNEVQFAIYGKEISALLGEGAREYGWALTATLKEVDIDNSVSSTFIEFRDGETAYQLRFGTDVDGDPIVNAGEMSYTLEGGVGEYHDYEMIYDALVGSVDVFVNGNEVISDWVGGNATTLNRIAFGAGSSSATGEGRFAGVQFMLIPEPGTGLIGLGLILFGMRRR